MNVETHSIDSQVYVKQQGLPVCCRRSGAFDPLREMGRLPDDVILAI